MPCLAVQVEDHQIELRVPNNIVGLKIPIVCKIDYFIMFECGNGTRTTPAALQVASTAPAQTSKAAVQCSAVQCREEKRFLPPTSGSAVVTWCMLDGYMYKAGYGLNDVETMWWAESRGSVSFNDLQCYYVLLMH